MPHHRCLDPQDPYAQREVLVAYWGRPGAGAPHLITAMAEDAVDILPDLTESQRDDQRFEIVQALGAPAGRTECRGSGPAAPRWGH